MKQAKSAWRIIHDSDRNPLTYNDGNEYKVKNNTNSTYILIGGFKNLETAELIARILTESGYCPHQGRPSVIDSAKELQTFIDNPPDQQK